MRLVASLVWAQASAGPRHRLGLRLRLWLRLKLQGTGQGGGLGAGQDGTKGVGVGERVPRQYRPAVICTLHPHCYTLGAQTKLSKLTLLLSLGVASVQGGWQNLALARLTFEMPGYSPMELLEHVRAPVLFIAANQDTLCPITLVRQAAATMGSRATIHEYNSSQ